jgi:hypothetical protein
VAELVKDELRRIASYDSKAVQRSRETLRSFSGRILVGWRGTPAQLTSEHSLAIEDFVNGIGHGGSLYSGFLALLRQLDTSI